MTAGIVAWCDVPAVSRAFRQSLPNGRRRVHFSDEGTKVRRQIMDCYGQLPTGVAVAVAEYTGGDDQVARNECLRALLKAFIDLRVGVAVLDTRGADRDSHDRRVIARALREGLGPAELHYTHRGSRDEPLLALPDAFGWCWGAGGTWKKLVDPLVVVALGP